MVCLIRKTAVACGLGIVIQVCMCWRVCVGEGAKVGREGGRVEKGREGGREGESGKEGGWLPGSCFLPGRATPSGGVGVGERLQSLSERGREGEREGGEGGMEGGRGTGEEESGGMLYHSLT